MIYGLNFSLSFSTTSRLTPFEKIRSKINTFFRKFFTYSITNDFWLKSEVIVLKCKKYEILLIYFGVWVGCYVMEVCYGLPSTCQRLFLGHHYQFTCYIYKCLLVVCKREGFIYVVIINYVTTHICFLLLVCNA